MIVETATQLDTDFPVSALTTKKWPLTERINQLPKQEKDIMYGVSLPIKECPRHENLSSKVPMRMSSLDFLSRSNAEKLR